MLQKVVSEGDRTDVRAFYESWSNAGMLSVNLGNAGPIYDRDSFYSSADILLLAQPFDAGDDYVIGLDESDEMASVVLEKRTGKVFYSLSNWPCKGTTRIELARTLREFVSVLQSKLGSWGKAP
jgi:hypothetical protein